MCLALFDLCEYDAGSAPAGSEPGGRTPGVACLATSLDLMWDLISAQSFAFSASRFCSSVSSSEVDAASCTGADDVDGCDSGACSDVACDGLVIVAVGGGNLGLMIKGVTNGRSEAALM